VNAAAPAAAAPMSTLRRDIMPASSPQSVFCNPLGKTIRHIRDRPSDEHSGLCHRYVFELEIVHIDSGEQLTPNVSATA
jgi:hypothetical protein